jgi:hypothetical protein
MMRIQVGDKTLHHNRPSQTLRDHERITAEGLKQFEEHFRAPRTLRHPIDLSLKLARSDCQSPVICDQPRFAQVILDFLFDLTLRDDRS